MISIPYGDFGLGNFFFFEEHTDTRNTLYDLNDIANTNEIDINSRSRIGPSTEGLGFLTWDSSFYRQYWAEKNCQ